MPLSTTKNTRTIRASAEKLYRAFTTPEALEQWMTPETMTAKVHHFDLREGGGYDMSLFYPPSDEKSKGKSAEKEDRYTARFTQLVPDKKIVQVINFDSADPAFAGDMVMEVTLEPQGAETLVTIVFKNIPPGIRPEDNEAGTEESLNKLEHYVAETLS